MILWINGAFGAGKTETATELQKRIPNSMLYDPEMIGSVILHVIPKEIRKNDFQDYPVWRESNYSILKYLDSEYKGVIIVPMTIVNPQYYDDIIGSLRKDGIIVQHFVLAASKETLEKRLLKRGEVPNSWPSQQIDRCLLGFKNELFQPQIDTENHTISEVAEKIASMVGIN